MEGVNFFFITGDEEQVIVLKKFRFHGFLRSMMAVCLQTSRTSGAEKPVCGACVQLP